MIVRESPGKHASPSKVQWPPRTPREVLMSSPRREKLLQQRAREISPSPCKRRRLHEGTVSIAPPSVDDNDDDEETLQLQLQEIQARLKLKKLQKAKQDQAPRAQIARSRGDSPAKTQVQVPLSPKPRAEKAPDSPRRVQLGIDKGLRAENVSLKRPRPLSQHSSVSQKRLDAVQSKHKSFNESLLRVRSQDLHREERKQLIEKNRARGFGTKETLATLSSTSSTEHPGRSSDVENQVETKSRRHTQLHAGTTDPRLPKFKRLSGDEDETSSPGLDDIDTYSGLALSKRSIANPALDATFEDKTVMRLPNLLKEVIAPDYDPPDTEHPDFVVLGAIASKSSPYKHAETQLSKSGTTSTEAGDDAQPPRTKFMVLKLTDLRWEVDLFLFDTAFTTFWKLPIGTVVALLNPGIMPPKPHMRDSGKFSLKLASSEDVILEIGTARDLGWCRSVKKDGKECGQWVDRSGGKAEVCDFHISLGVERAKAGRMEINGMVGIGLFGNTVKNSRDRSRGGRRGGRGKGKGDGLRKEGPKYDAYLGETAYVIPKRYGTGLNTARLLDAEDYVHGGLSRSERSQRRFAAQEKERSLAKALGSTGSGLGGEYMRAKKLDPNASQAEKDAAAAALERDRPANAVDLGLIGGSTTKVTLSPTRKRRGGQESRAEPMGWGGAYRRGLPGASDKQLPPSETSTQKPAESPRKRARFLIEDKGIRVPGRDSLAAGVSLSAEDDDGLDIV